VATEVGPEFGASGNLPNEVTLPLVNARDITESHVDLLAEDQITSLLQMARAIYGHEEVALAAVMHFLIRSEVSRPTKALTSRCSDPQSQTGKVVTYFKHCTIVNSFTIFDHYNLVQSEKK
jgi:hypothetical protein